MSLLGTVLKGVVGFATGGPLGAIGAVLAPTGGGGGGVMRVPLAPVSVSAGGAGMGMVCPPGTACNAISTDGFCMGTCVPFAQPGMGAMPSVVSGMMGVSGRCPLPAPRGFHWNQRTYCTLRHGVVQKCTRVIKNRRLNPANGRAARRAVRRITATHRLLKRIEKSIRRIKGVRAAKIPRHAAVRPSGFGKEVIVG